MRAEKRSFTPSNRQIPLLSRDESEAQDPLESRVNDFLRQVTDVGYNAEHCGFIQYSTNQARVHMQNEIEPRRLRKFDKDPYLMHPLIMAQEAARMRLHPTIISACLLHDVAEDVVYKERDSADVWMSYFESQYADYPDKDRLMRILRAELKTESLTSRFPDTSERREVVDSYMTTPVGKTAVSYLRELRGIPQEKPFSPTPADQEYIAEVIFDLNRIMTSSFVTDESGKKSFDPSILTVKILDTWQNLQTPGFWKDQLTDERKDAKTVAKLIRARILTNIAELLGMRKVASEMTQSLSAIQDTADVDEPLLRRIMKDDAGHDTNAIYVTRIQELETQMAEAAATASQLQQCIDLGPFKNKSRQLSPHFQMSWADRHAGVLAETHGKKSPGDIVYIAPSDPQRRSRITSHTSPHGFSISSEALSLRDGAMRPIFQTLYGRPTTDYEIIREPNSAHRNRLRFEDPSPRFIATLKSPEHKPAQAKTVPERHLFHADVCTFMGPVNEKSGPKALHGVVDFKLMGLVNLMLSPEKFIRNYTDEDAVPYVIIVHNKVFLASNATDATVHDIAKSGGVNDPIGRSVNSDEFFEIPVGDNEVLNRLRQSEKMNQYHMVVIEHKKKTGGTIYSHSS